LNYSEAEMKTTDQMPELSCREELQELDLQYEKANQSLQSAKDSNADSEKIASLLKELSGLRREMLGLETAEADRIAAPYIQKQPVTS